MFSAEWTEAAADSYRQLKLKAEASLKARQASGKKEATKPEGLFKQVHKCVKHLLSNPRHPSLQTHEYHSLANPYDANGKVFEAHVQQQTPGAYRLFWCYGPGRREITIIAITPHP